MSVAKHRWAAFAVLAVGVAVLIGWGRSRADETPEIRAVRDRLRGRWVATTVQAGDHRKAVGVDAAGCRIAFEGKSVAFRGMIGEIDASGTYFVDLRRDPQGQFNRIDLKLDEGWSIGRFEVSGDRLTLAINTLALPERLGVPTRARPGHVGPGEDRQYYVFRRSLPGE